MAGSQPTGVVGSLWSAASPGWHLPLRICLGIARPRWTVLYSGGDVMIQAAVGWWFVGERPTRPTMEGDRFWGLAQRRTRRAVGASEGLGGGSERQAH